MKILFSDEEEKYKYDIEMLVNSFYPVRNRENEEKLTLYIDKKADVISVFLFEGYLDETSFKDGAEMCPKLPLQKEEGELKNTEKSEIKNLMKQLTYKALSRHTKKTLPWGILTGIRPTKLAMAEFEKNEESILQDYYYVSEKKARLAENIARRERKILEAIDADEGYSLYVGIPFCPSTCLYCSFTSYPIGLYRDKTDKYVECLIKEIEFISKKYKNKKLNTIYFGGGTPTTLSANQLDRLLIAIEKSFDFTHLLEYTVEAGRPDSITMDRLTVLKKHNISRISVNPQTMNQKTLDIIGRRHTVEQVKDAFCMAREAGFDNINMDFIVGLPNETIEDVRATMNEMLKLRPDSITVHSLAIKRAAALNIFKDSYREMTIENNEEIMELCSSYAAKLDMTPYYLYRQKNMAGNMENVGYAGKGKAGIYNILIMEEKQTIIALGAGAVTKFVYPGGIERVDNVKNVDLYMERIDEMIARKEKAIDNLRQE